MLHNETRLKIVLDETAKEPLFKSITEIKINKQELFKYAVFMLEVPKKIKERDLDYFHNQIPHLESLLGDHMEFTHDGIANLSEDDRMKKLVSEAAGVGIGLKYSAELLAANPNSFKKIPPSTEGKYLDYSTIVDKREYEIETKGTVNKNYNAMKKDILAKKQAKNPNIYLKFGTIAMLRNGEVTDPESNSISQCVVVDDPSNKNNFNDKSQFLTQLLNYGLFLSYILDSKYYNKFIKPVLTSNVEKARINSKKIFGRYHYAGKEFLGEYFDRRLIRDNILKHFDMGTRRQNIYRSLTNEVGKTKIFLGLDSEVIENINKSNEKFFKEYSCKPSYNNNDGVVRFLDRDGILIVKSVNGKDEQIEKIFSESEVKKRLGLYDSFLHKIRHNCSAPCSSPAIKGKPCEIKTFREHCHFHR